MNLVFALVALVPAAYADDSRGADASAEERAHLQRLAAWSAVSVAGGSALMASRWEDPRARHFGIQAAGWGLVNAGIVAAAWASTRDARTDAQIADTREFLWLNAGLDVGYVGVGLTMAVLGRQGGRPGIEGAGWGVAVQGAGLLLLDAALLGGYPEALP
jgi:hypothetical protein